MLTLCRLTEPVSIRPPQSARLRPFTFFTSRALQQDGSEQLHLHMGFFDTLAEAERLAMAVRGRHPQAVATAAPRAFWQAPDAIGPRSFPPLDNESLTDTQVLNILETRQPAPAGDERAASGGGQIELIRPDDTGTRRALKEAVVRGMPVSFALQLQWSARPIEPSQVASLAMLKGLALYALESRSASRSCFFLRLGFFADAAAAKEAACHLRARFPSAAVVPVLEEEVSRAREACVETSSIPCLLRPRLEQPLESGAAPVAVAAAKPGRRGVAQGSETLEQTLARLAEREVWSDPDLLSDTGVRHLRVEVQKLTSGGRH